MDQLAGYKKNDTLDFRNNKKQLLFSYLLRLVGVLVFGLAFLMLANLIKSENNLVLKDFITIELDTLPAIISILLLIIDIVFVLYFHELVHATVFYITHRQRPKIGIRGFVIFAAAPDKVLNKMQLTANALAPFVVITLMGLLMIGLLPSHFLPWVFIPMVVNAAAAGGDFLIVAWALKQPKETLFLDSGDITNAYRRSE